MKNDYEVASETLPGGHWVSVVYDTDPINPRTEYDNAGTIVLETRAQGDYGFGDEAASAETIRAMYDNPDNICLPVFIYDHSGITISTTPFSCRWDSGQIGMIYISRKTAIKEWGKKVCTARVKAAAIKCIQAEIEELDACLTGRVYGYRVYDPQGEEVDSCWGFIGDSDDCLQEGLSVARACEREDMERRRDAWRKALKEARAKKYWASRDVDTLSTSNRAVTV